MDKNWWQSKTVWLNLAVAVSAFLATAKAADGSPLVPENVTQILLVVSAVANIILRSVTTVPLKPIV